MRVKLITFNIALVAWIICGCILTSSPRIRDTPQVEALKTVTALPTPSESPDVGLPITPTITTAIAYKTSVINCRVYFDAKWGNGLQEFGNRRNIYDQNRILGPYPPEFDEQGKLFIADPANQRIMMFGKDNQPSSFIPIPQIYTLKYGYLPDSGDAKIYWSNITISAENLYLVFYTQKETRVVPKLAVLTLSGQEQKSFELDHVTSIFNKSPLMLPDRKGGVYLLMNPDGILYFDAAFHSQWITLGVDWPYWNAIVGWDNNLYTYRQEEDRLERWKTTILNIQTFQPEWSTSYVIQATGIEPAQSRHLLGVDNHGQIYMSFVNQKKDLWIIRLWDNGKSGEIAKVPLEWATYMYNIILAPDGSLYSLVFDSRNLHINPQILHCAFVSE